MLKKCSHLRKTIPEDGFLKADAESCWVGAVPMDILPQISFYAGVIPAGFVWGKSLLIHQL